MTTLYLIRHAEAEGNVFRRLQGQYNSAITPNGEKQIAALAQRFSGIPIDAVYASDLFRTCRTATALYVPKGLPLKKDPRLRELHCGQWENYPFGYCKHLDPALHYAFSHDPRNWKVEGSEAFLTYTGRFLEAMEEIARAHEGQSVAIFSHGMVMRGVLQRLFFPEKDNLGHSENTAVTKLLWDGKGFALEYLNDDSHISPEISTLGKQQWWRQNKKQDFNMWFRDPAAEDAPFLAALHCPMKEGVRISMLAERPTGLLWTRPLDAQTQSLELLALLPEHRGIGLSPQLLGEAIMEARKAGKTHLRLATEPACPAALRLFAAYGVQEGLLSLTLPREL